MSSGCAGLAVGRAASAVPGRLAWRLL